MKMLYLTTVLLLIKMMLLSGWVFCLYNKDTHYGNLSVDNVNYLTSQEVNMGFSYANIDGSKLIVLDYDVDTDYLASSSFKYAIGENGIIYTVEYYGYQEHSDDNTGRQIDINFHNEQGFIYNVVDCNVIPNRTYMLFNNEHYEMLTIFQSLESKVNTVISNHLLNEYAEIAKRGIVERWLLSEYSNGYRISIVEFAANDSDLLAWLVLENEDVFQYHEFTATLSEDGYSGWQLGDGGYLTENDFYILSTVSNQNDIIVYLGWYAEEGEAIYEVKFSNNNSTSIRVVYGRYTLN